MKKDILFLCQFFYPEHNSSATLPFDTARYLAKQGFSVGALCGYPKEYSEQNNTPIKEEKDGVWIHRLRYLQTSRTGTLGRLINYFSFTFSALLHLAELKKYKSVIVYSNPPILPIIPALGNLLFGTKIIFVAYDIYPEIALATNSLSSRGVITKGMRWINHLLFKRVSRVVALTQEMKNFLIENRPEITAEQVAVISNWAYEKKADATAQAYQRFGYEPGLFIVSYFGNMGTCQEMETLLGAMRALKEDPHVRFLFVGHGNKKAHVDAVVRENGNGKVFDFLTGTAFEQAAAISSCCVVSLEAGLNGMCAPSKYYSYLQGGKAVIAIVGSGSYLADEVEQECIGHYIEINNVDRLKTVILDMEKNRDACTAMGKRAGILYEAKYSRERAMGHYNSLFREVLQEA